MSQEMNNRDECFFCGRARYIYTVCDRCVKLAEHKLRNIHTQEHPIAKVWIDLRFLYSIEEEYFDYCRRSSHELIVGNRAEAIRLFKIAIGLLSAKNRIETQYERESDDTLQLARIEALTYRLFLDSSYVKPLTKKQIQQHIPITDFWFYRFNAKHNDALMKQGQSVVYSMDDINEIFQDYIS